ncbi:MAG TPA: hypothetical protein DDW41_04690 [Candidatus Andersenbacteria bacterium]|nr:MAG: Phosphoesterase RecJ domain protein [Parcubacteria group bacterium GW2011_GWA2_45_14]OGY35776.1 MAG: hypothetical protein A3B76_03630 [Candidatus Andersenbacteria bacterium RIFCSPHIGHO2_02_FULL_46_16]HBE90478.1 hypothetical protein [Candidatus Andersenbacteria bacterium]
MSLSEIQQANTILNRASNVLLTVPVKSSLDAIASMIALFLTLQQSSQEPDNRIIDQVSVTHVPTSLQFLAGSSQVKTEPTQQPELVIDMVGPHIIKNIQQQELNGGTRLHITFPADTAISKDQLETTVRLLPYDAIIVIGASDLEELGPTFTKHADFFYNTPLINIDHRASNEQFGTVNLVDITTGSCAEVVFDFISARSPQLLNQDVATALYTGIVSGTDSFQKPSTTPRSFQVAANLFELHAKRELVIQYLVKTKPLKLIKLAGSIYAHLRFEEQVQLYWTILEKNDFTESGASSADVAAVMQELSNNIAGFNAAFLLYEDPASPSLAPSTTADHTYQAYLLLGHGLRPRRREIQEMLSATKENGALVFKVVAPSIEAAEQKAHEKIKQILP